MIQPIGGEVPPLPRGRGGCASGCLRTVVGFAILVAVVVIAALLQHRISARLQAPDYETGIIAVSGGYALDFLVGFAIVGLISVIAFRTTKQPGVGIVAGFLAVASLVLAITIGSNTWFDLLSAPATVRGTVTRHYHQTPKGSVTYYLELGPNRYDATESVYRQTVDGQCAILTYGSHTKVVTATAPCAQ